MAAKNNTTNNDKNSLKKAKDTLGEVFKGIVLTSCILCALAALYSVIGAIPDVKTEDWVSAGTFALVSLSCLFSYWLVRTLSGICLNLTEINNKLCKPENKTPLKDKPAVKATSTSGDNKQ